MGEKRSERENEGGGVKNKEEKIIRKKENTPIKWGLHKNDSKSGQMKVGGVCNGFT